MLIYIICTLLSMFIAWFLPKTKQFKKAKKIELAIISALPLFLLSALRYNVGTDYLSTIEGFFRKTSYSLSSSEPIFYILSSFLEKYNLSGQWIHVIFDAIIFVFVYLKIFEDSPNPPFSIFLFVGLRFYFECLNIERQFVGCAICLYATKYLYQENFKKFLLFVIIASCFHYSCIVFLPMYFFRRKEINIKYLLCFIVIIYIFRTPIDKTIRDIIKMTSYSRYLNSRFDKETNKMLSTMFFSIIYIFSYVFLEKTKENAVYLNLQAFCIISFLLITSFSLIVRFRYLFGFQVIILLPKALESIKISNTKNISKICIIIACCIYVYICTIPQDYYSIIPYQSIFSEFYY